MFFNISPLLWGKHLWKFMHYLTLSYPENPSIDEQNKIKNFFMIIGDYLPCEKCRINYKRHQEELPLTNEILQSRDKLILWLVDLHNIVNAETGKKRFTIEEFYEEYRFNKEDKVKENIFNKYIILIMVIILILLFLLYRKFNK
jgi:FAD-linked sulfhydryl oxidase